MNKKLKIAIFTDNFLPGVGGTENAIAKLANELQIKGHKVLIVAPHYKNENDNEFSFEILRKKSLKIDSNNYYAFPFGNKKILKQIENFNPDIIHCQSQASMLSLALKYAKKHKIPCISTIHTKFSIAYKNAVHLNCIVKPMLKTIGRKLKKASCVTAVSYSMKDEFSKYGFKNSFEVIKNGACFDMEAINSTSKQLAQQKFSLKNDDNILLFVGHVSKIKNLDFIFESLDKLYQKTSNFKMIFVGSGDGDKYFKKLAQKKQYSNNIIFTGKITDKKLLLSIYSCANLYVFPSIFDNDSLSIIEAALLSVPTITLENTGSSERLTNDQNGFIVENNPQKMADKIYYLLNNQDFLKNVGENARTQLPKSWEQTANEYIQLYYREIDKLS